MIASWQESFDKPRQCVEKQRHPSADKGPYSQVYGLPRSCTVVTAGPERRQSAKELMPLNCGAGEDSWVSLDSKEKKLVNLKGNQPWTPIGRTDAEAEAPVFWSSDANSRLIGKVPDVGKDWGQKKRASEDEMAEWHHQCNGYELGQTGRCEWGLACCCPWGQKELDTTGWLKTQQILLCNWLSKGHSNCRIK